MEEDKDLRNLNLSDCARVRIYSTPKCRKYFGQTECLLQYLKAKNKSMDLDFMRQCVASYSKEDRYQPAKVTGTGDTVTEKYLRLPSEQLVRKASSLDSIRHITIQVNNFNNRKDFTNMMVYGKK